MIMYRRAVVAVRAPGGRMRGGHTLARGRGHTVSIGEPFGCRRISRSDALRSLPSPGGRVPGESGNSRMRAPSGCSELDRQPLICSCQQPMARQWSLGASDGGWLCFFGSADRLRARCNRQRFQVLNHSIFGNKSHSCATSFSSACSASTQDTGEEFTTPTSFDQQTCP